MPENCTGGVKEITEEDTVKVLKFLESAEVSGKQQFSSVGKCARQHKLSFGTTAPRKISGTPGQQIFIRNC